MIKTKISLFLTITAFVALLAIGACTKLCNTGYEGSRCNVLSTSKFTGRWAAIDTPGNLTYIDTISQGNVIYNITLSTSFANHHFSHIINASVADDAITIYHQQPDSAAVYVQGAGTISTDHNTISLTYQIITGADSPQVITNYAGIWTRQN